MAISYSRNNTSGSTTNSWDTRFPLIIIVTDLWVTTQDAFDGWVDLNSASADVTVWGVVWGASWGTSAGWSKPNNVSNAWVMIQ